MSMLVRIIDMSVGQERCGFTASDARARYYDSLCRLGYAEMAVQGHAVARARWGHEQR